MNLQQQIEKANARGVGQFHIVKDGNITASHRGFVSTCVLAETQGAEVYNSFGDKVFPENDESPKYVVVHSKIGNDLTGPSSLEAINYGSNAYPPIKARALRIGETLKSSFNDAREIRRVS